MTNTKYGILDDAGQVVRWVYHQPSHGDYIISKVASNPRATPYEVALKLVGYAPF